VRAEIPAAIAAALAIGAAGAAGCWMQGRRHARFVEGLRIAHREYLAPKGSFLALSRSRRVTGIGAVVGGGLLGALVAGPPGAALGLAAGIATPLWIRRRNAVKEAAALEEQLPEAVSAMTAAMRAGMSLSQSIRFAAGEVPPPLSRTLGELVEREQLGVPIAASLEGWTKPDRSRDLRLIGGILQLHRRTGGDLPAVLDQLAETLRNRADATRELRGYTAQARLSGAILGGLPIGFFMFLSLTSRNDMAAAYRTPIGGGAIVVGLILEALAFVWIRRLLRVAT
jgi:tight adherence protein B